MLTVAVIGEAASTRTAIRERGGRAAMYGPRGCFTRGDADKSRETGRWTIPAGNGGVWT